MVECSMLLYASKRQSSICHHHGNSKARHAYPYLPVVISVISPSSSCRIWRRSRAAREEEEEESFSSFSHRLISSVTKEGRRRREGEETGVGRLSSSSRRGILLYTYVYVWRRWWKIHYVYIGHFYAHMLASSSLQSQDSLCCIMGDL